MSLSLKANNKQIRPFEKGLSRYLIETILKESQKSLKGGVVIDAQR